MNEVTPSSRFWAKVLFWYSCWSVVLCGAIHVVVAIVGLPELLFSLDTLVPWLGLFVVHGSVFVWTFQGTLWSPSGAGEAYQPEWPPVIDPTPRAVRVGRAAVWAAACNLGYWAIRFVRASEEQEIFSAMSAGALLSAIALTVVWGLRAENVFSWGLVSFMRGGNPTMTLPAHVLRVIGAKRRAIPFGKWMSGLLECCELAAKSTSTVRDATDCDDPRIVDCVEFTYEVLDELESRACLIHHRDRLSDEGHRAIRRFVHSTESIQCRAPEPLKWKNIINDAKSVLSMRDTLLKGDALQRRD